MLSLGDVPSTAASPKPTNSSRESPRARIQQALVRRIESYGSIFDAFYGVVPGMEPMPKGGAVRSVFFGVRDRLDVRVMIFTPTNIRVDGVGEMIAGLEGAYNSLPPLLVAIDRVASAIKSASKAAR